MEHPEFIRTNLRYPWFILWCSHAVTSIDKRVSLEGTVKPGKR